MRKLSKLERLYQRFLYLSTQYADERFFVAAILFMVSAMILMFGGK